LQTEAIGTYTHVRRSRGRHHPKPWTAAAAAVDKEEKNEEEKEEGEMINPGKPVKTRSHFHT